jgi:uncharacterized membrane protein YdfJ with MMPL/SSD domain
MTEDPEIRTSRRYTSTMRGAGIGVGIGVLLWALELLTNLPHPILAGIINILVWGSLGAASGRLWPGDSGIQSRPRALAVMVGIALGLLLIIIIVYLPKPAGFDSFLLDALSFPVLFALGPAVGVLWRTKWDREVDLSGNPTEASRWRFNIVIATTSLGLVMSARIWLVIQMSGFQF